MAFDEYDRVRIKLAREYLFSVYEQNYRYPSLTRELNRLATIVLKIDQLINLIDGEENG